MIKLTINGQLIEIEPGSTVLQACEKVDIQIPVFCYHPRLSIAGNCRMCLVEMEKSSKPVASCATPVFDGMVIHTNTPMVENARKGALEFLLINHPLDCPICDQGGECDLQDITMVYGPDKGRFLENKRAVLDKDFGPFIKTIMTRCIHCTRCIRFAEEIAGTPVLGTIGRGEQMEISTYVEHTLSSELSGNLIDICPVGALTSKPYAFKGRPWELTKTESIDVLDAVGSNIRIDTRGLEIMRILPKINEEINEEWISDKSRFSYDGLKFQRLDRPYIRKGGRLVESSWEEAFETLVDRMQHLTSQEIGAIVGNLVDVESIFALKELMTSFKSPHTDCAQEGARFLTDLRSLYLFNTGIEGIEKADLCLLVGTNPRHEAPLINARLRKRYLQGNFEVGLIGTNVSLTYPYTHISQGPEGLEELWHGKCSWKTLLEKAQNPMIILGASALTHPDGQAIQEYALLLAEKYGALRKDWLGYNILHWAASRTGALDLGFVPGDHGWSAQEMIDHARKGNLKVLYLLGADEIDLASLKDSECFIIYQGHHGDHGAAIADIILPGCAYTEKNAMYVNTEGRIQEACQALFPPGQALEDWKIIKSIASRVGRPFSYNTLESLREKMWLNSPGLRLGRENRKEKTTEILNLSIFKTKSVQKLSKDPLIPFIQNYYMTDSITRSSPLMAQATEAFLLKDTVSKKEGPG